MNENVSREIQSDQEDVIDLGKLFYKILVRWRWFIISVPLCLAAALFYCLISTPVYDIHGKVMISDTKKGELGTNVMMKELGLSRAGDVYGGIAVEEFDAGGGSGFGVKYTLYPRMFFPGS